MYVSISHHYCKPGMVDTARERMDKNSAGMTSEPGFLYRYRIERADRPMVLSAFTAWRDETAYDAYRNKRFGAGSGHDPKVTPYEKVETEAYTVHATFGNVPV